MNDGDATLNAISLNAAGTTKSKAMILLHKKPPNEKWDALRFMLLFWKFEEEQDDDLEILMRSLLFVGVWPKV